MEHRFKEQSNEEYNIITGHYWSSTVTDRKTSFDFYGTGNTEKEALENARDELWKFENRRKELSSYSSTSYDSTPTYETSTNSDSFWDKSLGEWILFIFVALVIINVILCLFVPFPFKEWSF
jgi:hypothetical protein